MVKRKVYWPKFFERKFLLPVALFVLAQIMKFKGCIGDVAWITASCIGAFGFVFIRLWLKQKGE